MTRSLVPLTVVPSCNVTPLLVPAGSPRCQAPVVAVSAPFGLTVHPVAVSNVSL